MAVQPDPIPPPPIPIPDSIDVDVMVFPRETEGELGLYHDTVITLVKELRNAGATASFQHPPKLREWIGEKHLSPDEVSLLIGIASNAGWAAIVAVLRMRHAAGRVRARIARYRKDASGTRWEWIKLEGPGDEVADAIEALQRSELAEARSRSRRARKKPVPMTIRPRETPRPTPRSTRIKLPCHPWNPAGCAWCPGGGERCWRCLRSSRCAYARDGFELPRHS
jgi:hypothetical protein